MALNPIGRLRWIGFVEAVSFLLLLFVAMPLKYIAGLPLAVRIVGLIHGILFMVYLVAAAQARAATDWSIRRSLAILAAALLPAGPFLIDRGLRRDEEALDRSR